MNEIPSERIDRALESEPLPEALAQLELHARANGLTELADWACDELSGYESSNNATSRGLAYRDVGVLITQKGKRIRAFKLAVSEGVTALAPYLESGCQLARESTDGFVVEIPAGSCWLDRSIVHRDQSRSTPSASPGSSSRGAFCGQRPSVIAPAEK